MSCPANALNVPIDVRVWGDLGCDLTPIQLVFSTTPGDQNLKLEQPKSGADRPKPNLAKSESGNSVKNMIQVYNAKDVNVSRSKPPSSKKSKNLEKRLTPQEEKNLALLENLHSQIDPTIPHDQLTEEQKYILQLKDVYQSTKLRPVNNKPRSSLAISKPLLNSVLSNPKLKEIRDNPDLFDLEAVRFGSVKISRQLSVPRQKGTKPRLSWSQRSKSLDLIPPPTTTLGMVIVLKGASQLWNKIYGVVHFNLLYTLLPPAQW